MKCIICGKEIEGKRRKYCSMKCAQKGFKLGFSTSYKNSSYEVSKLFNRFTDSFGKFSSYRGKNVFFIRVFVAACELKGYSDRSIAKGIGKERSDIWRHRHLLNDSHRQIAKEFLEDNNYVYNKENENKENVSKYNGFSYRS